MFEFPILATSQTEDGADPLWDGKATKRTDIRAWQQLDEITIPLGATAKDLVLDIPPGIALGLHSVVVQAMVWVDDDSEHRGNFKWTAKDIEPTSVEFQGRDGLGVVTTGSQINLLNRDGTVLKELKYATEAAKVPGLPDFVGGYKTDQVAFSADNRLLFVAGSSGGIAIVDTATLRIVSYWQVPGSNDNISSLAVSGKYLYVAEGGRYSGATGAHRLMRVNIDETSSAFLTAQQITLPASVKAPLGFFDLALVQGSNDYLAVTASNSNIPVTLGGPQQGDVFVLNLSSLVENGAALTVPDSAIRVLSFEGRAGRGPQFISPAGIVSQNGKPSSVRFLLSDALDYNAGLATVSVALNDDGSFAAAASVRSVALAGSVPGQTTTQRLTNRYQLNIQRAQGALLYTNPTSKTEYALVADYHMIFNNPDFANGSMVGKQAGGKLGVIRDPFGAKPEYLGATTPIISGSIKDLSLSPDGSTLWASLVFWSDVGYTPPPSGMLSWNVQALIAAAEANSLAKQNTVRPIPFDREVTAATPQKFDYGFVFDMLATSTPVAVQSSGDIRYGDIGRIDLLKLIRSQLNLAAGAEISGLNEDRIEIDKASADYATILTFTDKGETHILSSAKDDDLAAVGAASKASYGDGEFSKTGIFYLRPDLSATYMQMLREGKALPSKEIVIRVSGLTINGKEGQTVLLKIRLNDYAAPAQGAGVFFGDRPLGNPGYSEFQLKGSVGTNGANDKLDIYRIEQRVRYLGYGNSAIPGAGEITIDGKLEGKAEEVALRQFEEIVAGNDEYSSKSKTPRLNPKTNAPVKDQRGNVIYEELPPFDFDTSALAWLNAYNAPHWMTVAAAQDAKLRDTWSTPGNKAVWASSWVYDVLLADAQAAKAQNRKLIFAGAGSLGVQVNVGVNTKYIDQSYQASLYNEEYLLGLSSVDSYDLKDITSSIATGATSAQKLKYLLENREILAQRANGKWDYQTAQDLAALLEYQNKVAPQANNKEDQLLKDVLTVLSGIWADGKDGNGSYDEQWSDFMNYGRTKDEAQRIQTILFGSGKSDGSLINQKAIWLGSD